MSNVGNVDMTEIGESILKEYLSEVEEKMEDEKNAMRVEQTVSIAGGFWRFFIYFIYVFFANIVLTAIFIAGSLDTAGFEMLINATAEDWVEYRATFFSLVGAIQFGMGILIGIFEFKRFFRDIRQERIDLVDEQSVLIGRIITVAEEVLHRHALIKGVNK